MRALFFIYLFCIMNILEAKKNPSPTPLLPDFNTDILHDVLKPLDVITSPALLAKNGNSLEEEIRKNLRATRIPLSIQNIALALIRQSKILYLSKNIPPLHDDFLLKIPSIHFTLVTRMLQDASETLKDRAQKITCTYITNGDLVPVILFLTQMADTLHYQHITVHIIDLGSSHPSCHISVPAKSSSPIKKQSSAQINKKNSLTTTPHDIKKKLNWLAQHLNHGNIAIEYFCSIDSYASWAENTHQDQDISLCFMVGFEPLSPCLHALPPPQHLQPNAHCLSHSTPQKSSDIGNILILTPNHTTSPIMTAVIIYPQISGSPFQLYMNSEHAADSLTEQMQQILTSCTSFQQYVQTLSQHPATSHLTLRTCSDPYGTFENIAQKYLKKNGIAYYILTTPFGVHYLKRYNKEREQKRIIDGRSMPSHQKYFEECNLIKVWPPEKPQELTKAPAKRSQKK